MRLQARRTALCSLLAALSVVILMLGSLIPAALYMCPILAMAALLPIREEFSAGSAAVTYGAVSLLALLLAADKELALLYVFFGWYVPLQPWLEKLPRAVSVTVRLAAANLAAVVLYSLLFFVFEMDSVVEELSGLTALWTVILLLSANCLFVLTDILLHRLCRLWHKRFKKLLR